MAYIVLATSYRSNGDENRRFIVPSTRWLREHSYDCERTIMLPLGDACGHARFRDVHIRVNVNVVHAVFLYS